MLSCSATSASSLLYMPRTQGMGFPLHLTPRCSINKALAMMQANASQIYLAKPTFESRSRRMASAVALCYFLYKVPVSKKESKNWCFFLTEIGRTQYLINSFLSVPVTANNAGCNIVKCCMLKKAFLTVLFFLCLVSYIIPLTQYFWCFFYILKAFPLVTFSGTSKANF